MASSRQLFGKQQARQAEKRKRDQVLAAQKKKADAVPLVN